MEKKEKSALNYKELVIFAFFLFLIFLTSNYNYLLFHTLAELVSIIIAGGIFVIGWNSRKHIDNSFFLVMAIAFIFIGLLDLIHTLAFKGMGIFSGYDSNLPTSLWIGARYFQAFTYMVGIALINKKINANNLLGSYAIITGLILILIFGGLFPICYIEGIGLTPFKIISEYIIDIILLSCFILIYINRQEFEKKIYFLIIGSIIATMFAELAFTFYISVDDISNLVGHIFKIISFFLLYKSIIQKGIEEPFDLIFRKLKESEEKYRTYIEESLEGVWAIDANANTSFVNPSMAKILGYNKDEMIGKPLFTFMDENGIKDAQKKFEQRKIGIKEVHNFEFLHKSGKVVYTLLRTSPIFNYDGTFNGAMAFVTEITERKLAQEKVEYLAKFPSENPNPVMRVSENNILYTNIIGQELFEITEGSKIPNQLREIVDLSFRNKKIQATEITIKNRTYSFVITPITNHNYLNIYGLDITERKLAQEKIYNLSKFPSENPNPVMRVRRESILYSNKAAKELFGIKIGEGNPEQIQGSIKSAFDKNTNQELEIRLKNNTYSFTITPIIEENYANIYGMNITERKKAEQKLEEFASTVSHELRTPLTVLTMSIEYLKKQREDLNKDIEEKLVDSISRNIMLLKELVEDILTLARIDDKKIVLKMNEFTPHDIIQETMYLMEPRIKEKNITITLDFDQNIKAFGDKKRIDQVFRILIDNAINYSFENSEVKITVTEKPKGNFNLDNLDGILFQIKDNGRGIPKQDLPHIFERFFRSENAKDVKGSGLGLAIAKHLTELHDGEIFVESNYGEGSTFSVFLPKH